MNRTHRAANYQIIRCSHVVIHATTPPNQTYEMLFVLRFANEVPPQNIHFFLNQYNP